MRTSLLLLKGGWHGKGFTQDWLYQLTLVLGAVTDRYVVLATDRRISWRQGGRQVTRTDSDTKSFVLNGQFIMGFTGVARVLQTRMERLVAECLVDVRPQEYFTTLADCFSRTLIDQNLRHEPLSFLAIGFMAKAKVPSVGQRLDPVAILVSNSQVIEGCKIRSRTGVSDFTVSSFYLENRRHTVVSVGQPVPPELSKQLERWLRVLVKGGVENPYLAADSVVRVLRATAAKNKAVGMGSIVTILPSVAVPATEMVVPLAGGLTPNRLASLYVPPGASATEWYAPAVISPGMMIIGSQVSTEGWIGPTEGYG